MARELRKLYSRDVEFNRFQDNVKTVFDSLAKDIIFDRVEISATIPTTNYVIRHMLNRVPVGWIIVDIEAQGTVWRVAWDKDTITLTSSGSVPIKFWVF